MPVFDRSIEVARAGARIIAAATRLVVVEGNYLLLDDPGWAPLRRHFDLTVFLDVPVPVLEARLRARWTGYGMDAAAIQEKLEGNDLPNMRLVVGRSVPAGPLCPRSGRRCPLPRELPNALQAPPQFSPLDFDWDLESDQRKCLVRGTQPERDKNGEGRKRAENGGANETRPNFSFDIRMLGWLGNLDSNQD